MTKSIRKIEKALAKLEVLGSRLSCLFLVAFVFVCVFVALFLVAKVSDFAGSGEALDVSYLMQLTLSLLDFAIYGVILLVMRSIAKDVHKVVRPSPLPMLIKLESSLGCF